MHTAAKHLRGVLLDCPCQTLQCASVLFNELTHLHLKDVVFVFGEQLFIGRFYKLINSSGSRSARLNLSESVAHPRTSAINSVRLSTHCDVVFDDLTCMDTTIPCW